MATSIPAADRKTKKTNIPHIEWVDLYGDGVMHEVAVIKREGGGNTHFMKISDLDQIDKQRLKKILGARNINTLPLWDIMNESTLGNGMNALEYFHQLTKVLTPHGSIIAPSTTQRGY